VLQWPVQTVVSPSARAPPLAAVTATAVVGVVVTVTVTVAVYCQLLECAVLTRVLWSPLFSVCLFDQQELQ
jgi:hypothetical protein